MSLSFKSYRHGSHPVSHKDRTINRPTEPGPVVNEYIFPVSMHLGAPATPIVNVGDRVLKGQKIAEATGFISANIHSSVSGEVIAIEKRPTLNGLTDCIIVKNDHQEELFIDEAYQQLPLVEKVLQSGIVGLGGATFPMNVKLSPAPTHRLDTLIVNGAECEPYITADSRLMIEKADEIIEGIEIILSAFPTIKKAYIGIEAQSKEAISVMKQAAAKHSKIKVKTLKTMYPQGAEKTIIKNLVGREVPSGKLPAEVGCLVQNVGTIYALFQAVIKHQPNIDRIVTVNGNSVKNPKNLWVKYGTPLSALTDYCDADLSNTEKVLCGGPMMGKTASTLDIPFGKGTNGVTLLTPEDLKPQQSTPCIMCSECLNVCPVNLQPILISETAVRGQFEYSMQLGAMDCIECGNCTYICPAKIELLNNIRHAKTNIRAMNQK